MIFIDKFSRVRCFKYLIQLLFLFVFLPGANSQQISTGDVLQFSGNVANEFNKIGDKAKAMYAENIDNPYIPTIINKEYTLETTKEKLILAFKKYVNYYWASNVPAYRNLNTNNTFKKIANAKITDDYIFFTAEKPKNASDTVNIYYKDIVNRQIIYYVKIADNGFYMPYVQIAEHLITCGGKDMADYIFYMQQRYALKFYQEDLERFKIIAADYLKLTVKPEITEEQRKLLVQGNGMNDKMFYDQAISYYDQAIAINPVSSPNSYYNYALIAGVAGKYELAILNLKKYLLLLPEAEDARAVQDKIYEWEALMKQNQK